MAQRSTTSIRNIGLFGHGGAGKTTLAEALLAAAGRIATPGTVERGNTVCDFDPLERSHGHSLDAALTWFAHGSVEVHLVDTPGFSDFQGQALAVFPAIDTAAIVVNAQTGIEAMTRRMFARAGERAKCRMIIVNKIDAEGVDLAALVQELQDAFGRECLPINLPADRCSRVVDCFYQPDGEADFGSVAAAHTAIIDQVVEVDEALMATYLEQGEVRPEQLHAPFEQALREGHLVPICFVSARTGAGVDALLELIERLLPHPGEANPPPFLRGEGEAAEPFLSLPEADRHVVAHVFKVIIDPYVGKLGVFRVHQGTVRRDTQLYIGDARKPFKVGHLFRIHGKEHEEILEAIPGDLCAVAKVDDIHRDAVLHDSHDEDQLHRRPLPFPTPMVGLAISTLNRGDEQRLSDTLAKLLEEDPCLALEHNPTTQQTVLRALSDLHLRVTLERMRERYRMEVETQPPRIAYRETISTGADGHHRHKKQTGGAGQFGEVSLSVEPLQRGAGFEFHSRVVGGAIPSNFIPAVEKGVRDALASGAIAGYPLQDLRVTVTDGKHHPVDSKEVAFATAGRKAFLDAVRKARPLVLEPIVEVEVTCPADCMGAISGDLSGRRGQIRGTESGGSGLLAIHAAAPLAEMEGYHSQLKSLTAGQGSYTIELSHYEPVPPLVQRQLMADYRPKTEDD